MASARVQAPVRVLLSGSVLMGQEIAQHGRERRVEGVRRERGPSCSASRAAAARTLPKETVAPRHAAGHAPKEKTLILLSFSCSPRRRSS